MEMNVEKNNYVFSYCIVEQVACCNGSQIYTYFFLILKDGKNIR